MAQYRPPSYFTRGLPAAQAIRGIQSIQNSRPANKFMKKIIIIFLLSLVTMLGYSQTNADVYAATTAITNVWGGATMTDPTRDTFELWWEKYNHNAIWLSQRLDYSLNLI